MNKNRKIIEKDSHDELMLYDPIKDDVHILNPTAKFIYKLYKQGKTEAEIESSLKEHFIHGEDQNILENARGCLQELRAKGLVDGSV